MMKRLREAVLDSITEIIGISAVMGHPVRDYSENEPLALVHQDLADGRGFDVLSLRKGRDEAIFSCHSDGWGSLALRWQDCFYEYRLDSRGLQLTQCVNPAREEEALIWLNVELSVELAMFFRVDPALLAVAETPDSTTVAVEAA